MCLCECTDVKAFVRLTDESSDAVELIHHEVNRSDAIGL